MIYKMNKIKCELCCKEISACNYKKHLSGCEYIYSHQDILIKDYLDLGNIEKVSKKHRIKYENLSYAYKKWDVPIKSFNNQYCRQNNVNDNFFDIMNEIQYWLLGLMASDGSIINNKYITLSQSGKEGYKLILYINKLLANENEIRVAKTNNENSYSLYFSSPKILEVMKQYNIVSNKTLIYSMPYIPEKFLKDFIRGYIDGDGSIGIYDNGKGSIYLCVSFVGTKEFIEECQRLIPIKTNVRKHSLSSVYEIRWYGQNAIDFCNWCFEFENLYKSYKYYIFKKFVENFNDKNTKYKDIKEKIKEDLIIDENISIIQISDKYDIPFQTIYEWIKQWNKSEIIIPKRIKRNNNLLKNKIKDEYINKSVTSKEIMKKYHISKSTFYRYIKEE